MDLKEKLKSITERNEMSVSMGPYQKKLVKQEELMKNVMRAKDEERYAPLEVEKAEKQYYTFRDGDDGYNKRKRQQYSNEAQQQQNKLYREFTQHNTELSSTLATTQTQQLYLKNISEIQNTLLTKIKDQLNIKQRDLNRSDTNHRKSYYLDQEQQNITSWITLCNYTLIVLLCIYIYHNYQNNNTMMYIGVACIFATLTLLGPLIKLVQYLPTDVNVYTNWGYSPDAPRTSIVIYMVVALVCIYAILYVYDNQEKIIPYFSRFYQWLTRIDISRYTTTPTENLFL